VELQVSTRHHPGYAVVQVEGELDMSTDPAMRAHLEGVLDSGARQVIVDFDQVRFLDSTSLSTLVLISQRLRAAGGRLLLAAVREPVATVLALTGLDAVFDIYDTLRAAEASATT
jgi:anti-sigma B factor antagonist